MRNEHGHQALRRGRVDLAGQIYIVTTVTLDRARSFGTLDAGACVARVVSDRSVWLDARLLCWVLMPDHWHGLVELGDDASLSTVMRRMKSLTARAFNAKFEHCGSIWAPSFHDRALRRDDDVRIAARYLIENPVRARLVSDVGESRSGTRFGWRTHRSCRRGPGPDASIAPIRTSSHPGMRASGPRPLLHPERRPHPHFRSISTVGPHPLS